MSTVLFHFLFFVKTTANKDMHTFCNVSALSFSMFEVDLL